MQLVWLVTEHMTRASVGRYSQLDVESARAQLYSALWGGMSEADALRKVVSECKAFRLLSDAERETVIEAISCSLFMQTVASVS